MRPLKPVSCIAAGVFASLCASQVHAQTADADIPRLKTYTYQSDASLVDQIGTEVADARRMGPAAKQHVAALLAAIVRSDAAFDAKEFACRQLIFVAGPAEAPILAAACADPALAAIASTALSKIPGKSATEAAAAELQKLPQNGSLLLLLADKGDARAIPGLCTLLASPDADKAGEAARGLARISAPAAGRALTEAFTGAPAGSQRKTNLGAALIRRADIAAAANRISDADALYALCDASREPMLRAAALRGQVAANPAGSASLVLAALKENGTPRQSMAADILRTSRNPSLRSAVSSVLPGLARQTQIIVLKALQDQGERADWPGIRALAASATGDVQLAAIEALGSIGTASALPALLQSAASGATKQAAQDSICRIPGTGVDNALRATLLNAQSPVAIRAVCASVLARRRAASALADISTLLTSRDQTLRSAGFAALRDSAPASFLPKVLSAALAIPADNRDSAIEACVEIAKRGQTEEARTAPVLSRLQSASSNADRLSLLGILNQIGGPKALAALTKAAADGNSEVHDGALALLADWPSEEPIDLLLNAAKNGASARTRAIGLRGYLKMIGANEQRTPEKTLELLHKVAPLVTRPEDKRLILSAVSKVHSIDALRFAADYLKQEAVREEAESAVVEIARTTITAFTEETTRALNQVVEASSAEPLKAIARQILKVPASAGEFITAWELSPQYMRDGADYKTLFDTVFPAETGDGSGAEWRLMTPVTTPSQPWLMDILAVYPGEQKVAYMRTAILSPEEQNVVLEMGSDDGIKAWVNGTLILSDNTARGVAPGQEKAKAHLKKGWNVLMLKITQNIMGWGACARVTDAEGKPVTGLRYSVPSDIPVK